jgi:hypothetical protein
VSQRKPVRDHQILWKQSGDGTGWLASWVLKRRGREVSADVNVVFRHGTWFVYAGFYTHSDPQLWAASRMYREGGFPNPREASLVGLRFLKSWGFKPGKLVYPKPSCGGALGR